MGNTGYVVLGLLLLIAVVGRVDLRLRRAFESMRARQDDTNASTASAIADVQRRLAVGPVPVRVHGERGLRGHRLVLDTGDVVLRLHRYGGSDLRRSKRDDPATGGPVFLTDLRNESDLGWQVRVAGLAGTTSYQGWLLERRDRPAGAAGSDRATASSIVP